MNELLERQAVATKMVHWPTGLAYACNHHAEALQKIASAMGIHLSMDDYAERLRQCTNCLNETSIARGDADALMQSAGQAPESQACDNYASINTR